MSSQICNCDDVSVEANNILQKFRVRESFASEIKSILLHGSAKRKLRNYPEIYNWPSGVTLSEKYAKIFGKKKQKLLAVLKEKKFREFPRYFFVVHCTFFKLAARQEKKIARQKFVALSDRMNEKLRPPREVMRIIFSFMY